ncbi:hypothetical protein [Nocardioides sp. Leaf285]|uniref:hypothetical protein n=1 Tax=Nocardioides sp. Leaf285 TaxID=1736322 RepID=UPI0012EB0504|nr:hypothetical protein [Nocardioides sp. Leaf285]
MRVDPAEVPGHVPYIEQCLSALRADYPGLRFEAPTGAHAPGVLLTAHDAEGHTLTVRNDARLSVSATWARPVAGVDPAMAAYATRSLQIDEPPFGFRDVTAEDCRAVVGDAVEQAHLYRAFDERMQTLISRPGARARRALSTVTFGPDLDAGEHVTYSRFYVAPHQAQTSSGLLPGTRSRAAVLDVTLVDPATGTRDRYRIAEGTDGHPSMFAVRDYDDDRVPAPYWRRAAALREINRRGAPDPVTLMIDVAYAADQRSRDYRGT